LIAALPPRLIEFGSNLHFQWEVPVIKSVTALLTSVLLASTANAEPAEPPQTQPTPPTNYNGLNTNDLKTFCMFESKLYSSGAIFCSLKHVPMKCDPPNWTIPDAKTLDPTFCEGFIPK
jgi:hypothetical protein